MLCPLVCAPAPNAEEGKTLYDEQVPLPASAFPSACFHGLTTHKGASWSPRASAKEGEGGFPRKQLGLWDLPGGGPLASAHASTCPVAHTPSPQL